VLQGERERARDNWSLGRFTIDFERAPRGIARVGVQFEIDANGILHVLARDLKSGEQTVVEMKSAVDVDDADVQRMVEESVEHAFEDLQLRRWVEASATARETVAAARRGLAECADEIEPDYRSSVEVVLGEVEKVLAGEDRILQSGDSARLKAAVAKLDEVTRPLADRMMERAMEAMLRRRGLVR
jgi:molecular chaperone DnaK